jgi:multisubunit Na+/H+ antiporter MnhE subunit
MRGLFFALIVSVAVIVAGVAPLVEASHHDRRVIVVWTLVVCVLAGVAYAVVRVAQSTGRSKSE